MNIAIIRTVQLGLGKFLSCDFSKPWTVEIARIAIEKQRNSKLSQKAFAEAHGFPVSRFRSKTAQEAK
jgi:hypothetical protein